jgi:uncharacterized protein (UPF0332 family)
MATWREVANDNYGAASELVNRERWRSAISRAYYAAFALVAGALKRKGVAMPRDWEGPAHVKMAALVCDHLTELRDVRWRVFHCVRRLYALRLDADYRPSLASNNGEARSALGLMIDVFHAFREAGI